MEAIQQTIMYFHKGGLVMWPLLFCSIAVIAITIERFLFYKAEDSGQSFAAKYCALLRTDEKAEALQLAEAANGECAKIVADAAKITGGKEQQKAFLESQAGIFIAKLKKQARLFEHRRYHGSAAGPLRYHRRHDWSLQYF